MIDVQRIVDARDILGETPVWCPREQALYWVDVRRPAAHRWDSASGRTDTWPMPELAGSLTLCESGGILIGLRTSVSRFDPKTGKFAKIAAPANENPDMRLNDGKSDRRGRFWVGSMNDITREPVAHLYRVEKTGACVKALDGVRVPNSLCWSPDDRTMYFTGPTLREVFAYDFDAESGTPGRRRVFAAIPEPHLPDGATVDEEGCVWLAVYQGWRLHRYAPDGRLVRTIELPVQSPTSLAFGGPDLRTLFITTATQRIAPEELAKQPLSGGVLAINPGVRGLPEPRFAG